VFLDRSPCLPPLLPKQLRDHRRRVSRSRLGAEAYLVRERQAQLDLGEVLAAGLGRSYLAKLTLSETASA